MHILPCRLHTVVPVAERLPVAPVPEQFRIPAMGNHMVHIGGFHIHSLLHTFHTERMDFQETFPLPLPGFPVATGSGRPYFLRMHSLVLLTILRSGRNKVRTPWMPAGDVRLSRHSRPPFYPLSQLRYIILSLPFSASYDIINTIFLED